MSMNLFICYTDPIVTQTCRRTVRGPGDGTGGTTFLTSPDYPNLYPENTKCHWNISVPCRGIVSIANLPMIKIDFDLFQLRPNQDELDIKRGTRLIRRIQGRQIPAPFISEEPNIE